MVTLKTASLPAMSKLSLNKIRSLIISLSLPNCKLSRFHLNPTCQSFGLTFGTSKVVAELKASSTIALMLEGILQLLNVLT